MNGDGVDKDVYIYVVRPRYVYRFIAHMVCLARREAAPDGAVFVCYVVFNDALLEHGVVVNWEWVFADPEDPALPANYSDRYDEKVWANG